MINKKREVVLDTETTGLSFKGGDRIIEIGCVELFDHIPTGKNLQIYFNPETKKVSEGAIKIHNITNEFLKKQNFFRDRVEEFLDFISDDDIIIHNAKFDIGFLNNELTICGRPLIKNHIIDTLLLARKKLGGGQLNLDALCKRFDISTAKRKAHGALLDSNLLADVYLELVGGRQRGLDFVVNNDIKENVQKIKGKTKIIDVSEEEMLKHKKFIETIKNNLWSKVSN